MRARRFHPNACLFIGFSAVIACTAQPLQNGQPPPGPDSSVAPGTTGGTSGTDGGSDGASDSRTIAPLCDALPASAVCSQNPTGSVAVQSMSDLVTAMTGRWILCGQESVFAVGGGDIGLENHGRQSLVQALSRGGRGRHPWCGVGRGGHLDRSRSGQPLSGELQHLRQGDRHHRPCIRVDAAGDAARQQRRLRGQLRHRPPHPHGQRALRFAARVGRCCRGRCRSDRPSLRRAAGVGGLLSGSDGVSRRAVDVRPRDGDDGKVDSLRARVGLRGGGRRHRARDHGRQSLVQALSAEGAAAIRGAGWDEEGTWTALDLGDHFQVNFNISGSGTVITAPVFASTPRAIRLDNNGVYVGNYVIDPNIPTGSVRCASPPGRG